MADKRRRDAILRELAMLEPRTKEELWYYFKAQFGMDLVREAVCSGHAAQLDVLWDILRGEHSNYLIVTNRHGGKTFSIAALVFGMALWRPGTEVSVISGCIAPWTPIAVKIVREGRKNGVYVVPASLVREGDLVWTTEGWRAVQVVGKTAVNAVCLGNCGLERFIATPEHLVWRVDANGKEGSWVNIADVRFMRDFAYYPITTRGASLLGEAEVEIGLPNPKLLGFAAAVPWRRRGDEIVIVMPFKSRATKKRQEQINVERAERIAETLRTTFSVSRVVLEPCDSRRSLRITFPENELPGIFTAIPLGNLPQVSREWRRRFLSALLEYAPLGQLSSEFYGESFKLLPPMSAEQFFFPRRVTTTWDRLFTVIYTLVLAGLDLGDIFAALCYRSKVIPEKKYIDAVKAIDKKQSWRRDKLSFYRSEQDAGARFLQHPATLRKLVAGGVVQPFFPSETLTLDEIGFRYTKEQYFLDFEIDGADNFLTLNAGIVHNSKKQTERWKRFFDFAYSKQQFRNEFVQPPMKRGVELRNNSAITLLSSSETSARSPHSDIMVMDEVDMIRRRVFDAAQFATDLSEETNSVFIALSTYHEKSGNVEALKHKLEGEEDSLIAQWCLKETIAPCNFENCKECKLFEDCAGIARHRRDGFLKRNKLISLKERVSKERWEIEMLLVPPSAEGALFKSFKKSFPWVQPFDFFSRLPLYRGFDFGLNTAVIWAQYDPDNDRIYILDSKVYRDLPTPEIANRIREHETLSGFRSIQFSWGDARGGQLLLDLKMAGIDIWTVPWRTKREKIDTLRRYIELDEDGIPRIIFHSRNLQLIEEIATVPHFAAESRRREVYEKLKRMGGFHLFDALVYLVDGLANEVARSPLKTTIRGSLILPPAEPSPISDSFRREGVSLTELPDDFNKPLDPDALFEQ